MGKIFACGLQKFSFAIRNSGLWNPELYSLKNTDPNKRLESEIQVPLKKDPESST